MIDFSFRELKNAWHNSYTAFLNCQNKTNAHRLLLFYAVETGLKAVVLKQEALSHTQDRFFEIKHDLNKILRDLRVGRNLYLPNSILLMDLKDHPNPKRNIRIGDLNQVWRYGAKAVNPTDSQLEAKLSAINEWISGELK